MMDGIILAALALLSVPVLLIVILVKVCGLENKVADLTKKVGVIDFTQRHVTAAQAGLAICSEPSRAKRVPRDAEYAKIFMQVSRPHSSIMYSRSSTEGSDTFNGLIMIRKVVSNRHRQAHFLCNIPPNYLRQV